MNRFVTAGAPAGAAIEGSGVVATADQDLTGDGLLLEMALETERGIALGEHLLIDGAVRLVAGQTPFPRGLVFIDKRAALDRMTFEAGFILRHRRCPSGYDGRALVRIMAVIAAHFPFRHRMMVRQTEAGLHFQVALETGLGRFAGIDNRVARAARFIVDAARPVARLAPDIRGIGSRGPQPGVDCGGEIPRDVLVALGAAFRTHKCGAGNLRWNDDRSVGRRGAGNRDDGNECDGEKGNQALPMGFDPPHRFIARRGPNFRVHEFVLVLSETAAWQSLAFCNSPLRGVKSFYD